ncbi:hypothetical protein AMS68_006085 [Peltaster fructicola]|uniref:N-acetylglucosaminyl transferase component Gpi1 n=1 Tax=Peltaster fructicola TaxID=286661 RepID=A0A6H0Y148_9PEZI|nr:hypothetical protein AMS68_006085 [Peltaster fructicola]
MHPVSILTFGIFFSGYITARWDLVTRLYELAIFAWDRGVITRAANGFAVLFVFFLVILIPIQRIAAKEAEVVGWVTRRYQHGIMTTRKHGLMRIFWPSIVPAGSIPGVLVGWRNSDHDILVIGVLEGVDPRNVEHALKVRSLFRNSPHPIDNILARCGGHAPVVLGTINLSHTTGFDAKFLELHQTKRQRIPVVRCSASFGLTFQVIVFDQPDPKKMQYLSLTPMSLALDDKRGVYATGTTFDRIEDEEEAERKRKQKLVEKLKLHTVVHHPPTQKDLALPTIFSQINCSAEINEVMQKNINLVGVRAKRSLSVGEKVVASATDVQDQLNNWLTNMFVQHAWPVLSQVFILGLMVQRTIAECVLIILQWRPLPDRAALRDVSATAQQLDIRLQQLCYWPAQYITLHRRRTDWHSITNSHTEYIRFFNSLWLVANDIIIGITLGSYIVENADAVAAHVQKAMDSYAIDGLQRMIVWLMDQPAGLKLNNELAAFLGDLFLWVIDYWAGYMQQFETALPHIIRIIGWSSFAGASLPIALASDLVSVLTTHIYAFYVASARIYNWQLTIILSLFHLFRGKKRNVLRNRIDSCDYDLDQLLLGTILFTVLFFLLPTVAVFYATFAGARMGVIVLKAALDTWLACLNHFPLFALMLRLKDSRRLPGGVRFELYDTHAAISSTTNTLATKSGLAPIAYVKLESVPLPLQQTFAQYAQLGHRLRKHYLSPRVFLGLISGQFVPPIHRKSLYSLQYSMLPANRVSINELWQLLTTGSNHADGHTNGHVYGGIDSVLLTNKKSTKKEKRHWWNT